VSEAFLPGFGTRLKAGREAKALTPAEVAAKLKLTARQVQALEEEDLSHLPGEVFVRGFVRNYARLVDVDADELIAPVDVQASVSETITAPSAGVSFSSSGVRRWLMLPLLALAAFLVLVTALYHWLRKGEEALVPEPVPATAPGAAASPPAPEALPQMQPLQPAPEAAVLQDGTPAAAPTPTAPAPTAAPSPVSDKPSAPVAPVSAAAAKTGDHTLRFEPSQDAWIQVVDGKGQRFSKLVRSGGVETFSGEPPFRLVVGEAARVRMSYDGHVIDLSPFIGQKVARLTLE
jgi:cytoskeleton protein RodZ